MRTIKDTPKLRIVRDGGSLSESDLSLISNTDIIINMMRNRLLVVLSELNIKIDWDHLVQNAVGFYHIRPLGTADTIYQVWFERESDLNQFEKQLMLEKLATA